MPKPKRMTKEMSLILCIELWKWLEKNTSRLMRKKICLAESAKGYWPGHKKYIDRWDNLMCPCCTYVTQMSDKSGNRLSKRDDCVKWCPLIPLWYVHCNKEESPYRKWQAKGERKYAREIWQFAEKELAKLRKNRRKRRKAHAK